MEVVTLDIMTAVLSSLRYANKKRLNFINKRVALSTILSRAYNEEYTYRVFMASMLKEISSIGQVKLEDTPKANRDRIYKATEIIRIMPEIIPFQYNIADAILESEERMDGSGQPSGKNSIRIEAQIIGIAEDYLKYENLELLKNKEKYNEDLVKMLEIELENPMLVQLFDDDKNLERYIQDTLNKYNVYKEYIEGVEEEQFLSVVASIIDTKHSYTSGHTKRVAAYSYAIAKAMKYNEEQLTEIRYAAYLHDIGKLAVDIDILDKPSKLTNEEFDKIKLHAKYSYEILEDTPRLKRYSFGALHHERIDGKGYPFGLKGDEIPKGAKIIAVADILDALTSNRSYRKPFTFEEAFELLEIMEQTALDKEIVDVAKDCFNVY